MAKDKLLEYVRNPCELKEKKYDEQDKEDYYKLLRIDNGFSSNYIENKSNLKNHKTLLTDDYLYHI